MKFLLPLLIILTFCCIGFGQTPQKNSKPDLPDLSKNQIKEFTAREVALNFLPSVALLVCDDGTDASQGSGFFIKPGLLVTNFHVIEGMKRGYAYITINGTNEKKKLQIMSVVSFDKASDLAILYISEAETLKIPPLTLATDDKINEIGATVYALGNPEGLIGTISPGIISAQVRSTEKKSRLQITAPISHGSSGGPVLNAYGNVIGVAVGSLSEGQSLNFAVPVTLIHQLLSTTKDLGFDDFIKLYSVKTELNGGWFWMNPEVNTPTKETPKISVIGPRRAGESLEVMSLRKLEGVRVIVEDLDEEAKYLFTASQIQLEIESKLRNNGIKILSEKEWLDSPGSPYLYLTLDLLLNKDTGVFTYSYDLSLNQNAKLVRDPSYMTLLPTWRHSNVGYAGSQVASAGIRTAIGKYVDRFCLDFLKANQAQ